MWKANTVNAEGQVTQSTLGNNLVTTTAYKPTTGTIDSIQTGTAGAIQNLTFTFDDVGNLRERKDLRLGKTETFLYDGLYRLTSATVTGQAAQTTSFDSLGNITSKTGVGTYSYGTGITTTAGSAGPHAVVATTTGTKTYRYDANGNMTQELTAGAATKTLSYSSYDAVVGMVGSGAPAPSITFLYGSDRNRIQQNHSINGVTTYVYAGSANLFERLVKNTTTTDTHYLYAGGQNIGVFIKKTGAANETRYFHRDHLGSIDVVTSATGTVIERMSYDAWGKRRNADWTDAASQLFPTSTPRGFTGHEMLDSLGLIHMNGRVYNPTLGRFVSADSFVPDPNNLQSLNRYSYVYNNPLSLTDPSGHLPIFGVFFAKAIIGYITSQMVKPLLDLMPGPLRTLLAIVVGFYAGGGLDGAANWGQAAFGGFSASLVSSGGDYRQAIIGAVTAAAFYNVGHGAVGKFLKIDGKELRFGQHLVKAVAHGVVGGISAELQGGTFIQGFASAGTAQALAPWIDTLDSGCSVGSCVSPIRVAVAAGAGGVGSSLGGGKFGNGAMTGAFSRLFNEEIIKAKVELMEKIEFAIDQDLHASAGFKGKGYWGTIKGDSDGGITVRAYDAIGTKIDIRELSEALAIKFKRIDGNFHVDSNGDVTYAVSVKYLDIPRVVSASMEIKHSFNLEQSFLESSGYLGGAARALRSGGVERFPIEAR